MSLSTSGRTWEEAARRRPSAWRGVSRRPGATPRDRPHGPDAATIPRRLPRQPGRTRRRLLALLRADLGAALGGG